MKGLLFLLCTATPVLFWAQTGPGGVGNATNNAFWVKAHQGLPVSVTDGNPIAAWNDLSGNGNHLSQSTAVQQPIYRSNVMNGYPAIQFDNNNTAGQNDFLIAPDSPVLDNTAGLTIFSVVKPMYLASDARAIVSKRTNVSVQHSYMFFFYTSDYLFGDIVTVDNRFSTSPTSFTAGTNYLVSMHYDGTQPMAQRTKIFAGNTTLVTAPENDASIPDYASPLLLGSTHVGDPRPFGGYMAEVAIYREALNETRRIIVNNYMSAKYNIPLAANDVYTMDNAASGNYDHEMAGIGRISATDLHNDAKGSGPVRILNPSGLDNNEFMLWGHDNGMLQANNLSDVPSGVQARFGRAWRVSEVTMAGAAADVGAVDIRWDLTGLGAVNASHLRLLVDTDNDGIFSDETPISGATSLGGNVYQFTGVTALTNQSRFTLSTTNKNITPLPIELVSFTAELLDKRKVALKWETASEENNDYFTVERSEDGISWTDVSTVQGAGNSSVLLKYSALDVNPFPGVNYYRLKQTDFNGAFTYSDVRSVILKQQEALSVYPNPATESVFINRGGDVSIQVQNTMGQVMDVTQVISETVTQLNIAELPAGTYFLLINEDGEMTGSKLIVGSH